MKKYHIILSIRVDVETVLNLTETIKEVENDTQYSIGNTENVRVIDTEILKSQLPNS